MDTGVIVAIVGCVEAVGVALIGLLVASINRKNEQYRMMREEREELERKERQEAEHKRMEFDAAKLELLFATANGTDVLLQAAHGDQVNGNVDAARESISRAKSECNHILNMQAVKSIVSR